jgi:signal transduction histidine kinase
MRRLWPTLAALALGTLGLVWGLVSLERIFIRERDGARNEIALRQRALSRAAGESVQRLLRGELDSAEAKLRSCIADPVLACEGVLAFERGERLVPPPTPRAGEEHEARDSYLQAIGAPTGDDPVAERLRLVRAVGEDLRAREPSAAQHHLLDYLEHRSAYRLRLSDELAADLRLLEVLELGGGATLAVRRSLLRDGFLLPGGATQEGLQRALVRRRGRLSAADVAWVGEVVSAASRRAGLPFDDFTRALESPGVEEVSLPGAADGPILSGTFLLQPTRTGGWNGVRIDRASLEQGLADELRALGLVQPPVSVHGLVDGPEVLPLGTLTLSVQTPEWRNRSAALEHAFRWKTLLVLAAGLLTLVIFGLAITVQSRRLRFVELRSAFVATVSHEFRTPLASIRLLAETLEQRLEGLPEARDYPERIVQETESLTFLVENILSFNRIERGRWVPRRERMRVGALVDRARQHASPAPPRTGRLELKGAEVSLEADGAMLELLFANLFRNACLYGTRDPVDIRVTATGGQVVRIQVSDNGAGIPAGDVERVFDEFHRASSTAAVTRGTGLGLAICRRIARLHGGDLRVAFTGPEGTAFEIELPGAT